MTRVNRIASNKQKLDMVLLCMPSQFELVKFGWELSGLVSVGIIWFGVVEFKLVWRMSLVWCGWVWFGVVEFGLICMSLVWYGWVRFGLVWLSLSLVWWGWFLFGLEDEHLIILRAQAQLSSWVYELVYNRQQLTFMLPRWTLWNCFTYILLGTFTLFQWNIDLKNEPMAMQQIGSTHTHCVS